MRKNISETLREEMKDLYDAGIIDETTMRKFDKNSLQTTNSMLKQDVKRIRLKIQAGQPESAVAARKWEI